MQHECCHNPAQVQCLQLSTELKASQSHQYLHPTVSRPVCFQAGPCNLSLYGLASYSREVFQSNVDIKKADPTNGMGLCQCYMRLRYGLSQTWDMATTSAQGKFWRFVAISVCLSLLRLSLSSHHRCCVGTEEQKPAAKT